MRIKYLGHSCFKMTSERGIRIMTDPFDESLGYALPQEEVDIVTTSHNHFDHGYIEAPTGDFTAINKVGNFYVKDIPIRGIATYHDKEGGARRGSNTVYIFTIDDLKICHLGDLGHIPDSKIIDEIGHIDILMIPVGGVYTIDSDEAKETVELLNPKIIIPMHYKTRDLKIDIGTLELFTEHYPNAQVLDNQEFQITKDDIHFEGKRVIVLSYK